MVISNFVWLHQILLTLYVQYTKNPAVKKWLPFEVMSAVYIVTLYIVPFSFVQPYPIYLTSYVQYTQNKPSKSGSHLSLCAEQLQNKSECGEKLNASGPASLCSAERRT